MDQSTIAADSTVRSQDSNNSSDSKETKVSKISDSTTAVSSSSSKNSKPESCLESKHSKDVLINTSSRSSSARHIPRHHHHHHHQQQHQDKQHQALLEQQILKQQQQQQQQRAIQESKDDFNVLMFTSCGQLLLGVVLVVFGVLVLVHGASLGSSGAGLWAGAGALVAGALGVVATLATSGDVSNTRSGFSSAHLASSLIALALSNMAAITALTAVVRDSQKTPPDVTLLTLPDDEHIEEGWAGLLASIGLLVGSVVELFVSGYTCVTLAPKLCDCLRPEDDVVEEITVDGKTLKTRNMVQQWVIAQNHVPKNQPIYVVQPVVPMHPVHVQPPYGMQPAPGKYAAGFLPAGAPTPAGCVPIHVAYPTSRPPSQIMRGKHQQQKRRRHSSDQTDGGPEPHLYHHRQRRASSNSQQNPHHSSSSPDSRHSPGAGSSKKPPAMASIGEDQLQKDLARTYTGLDKRISEEFISIAMDPERKSKASSHHGSDVAGTLK